MKYLIPLLLAGVLLLSCDDSNNNNSMQPNVILQPDRNAVYTDFGNGVYYFAYVKAEFGTVLASFKATHKIISVVEDGTGLYGVTVGYFVICEQEKP